MKNALQRLFDLNLPLYTCFTLYFFSKCKGFADIKLFFMHQERPVRSFSWASLRHAIYFVGFSEKYKDTSSLCRLVSDAPETFSASPLIWQFLLLQKVSQKPLPKIFLAFPEFLVNFLKQQPFIKSGS